MRQTSIRFALSAINRQYLIEKTIRVDHIGELAANQIYAGQNAILASKFPILFFVSNIYSIITLFFLRALLMLHY